MRRSHDPESGFPDQASTSGADACTGDAATRILFGDPISDVLDTIRLQGAVFFLWEPGWPYSIGVADGRNLSRHILPGSDCLISYHIVTKGPCWAAVIDEAPIRLETGDTLVLPRGDAYKIANAPEYPVPEDYAASIEFFRAMAAGNIPTLVTDGGPGPENNKLICGFLGCRTGPFNPLLSTLPRMLRVPGPTDGDDPLSTLIGFALTESRQSRGGERCMLTRLSEVMFVEVLRRYLRSGSYLQSSWLSGLQDPIVGQTLALLHKDIAANWTVQALAERIGTSRSTLSERFSRVIGVAPIQYFTQWRMQVACNRLRDTSTKVYAIASEVGYESEESFGRAFKRVVGCSPSEWRAQCQLAGSMSAVLAPSLD